MKKLALLLTMMLTISAFAQVTTSKIQGTVTDDAGALFGATVVAKHLPTGSVMGAMSQENGNYAIPNLRVGGPYTVTFSFVGYKTIEYTDIYLQLGKTTNIDMSMVSENQELDEVVIRYTKNNTFNSDRTGAETSLGSKEIQTLPSISRSAADFYRLEPTASGGSFGGRNDQFNNFSLDGSIFNNPFGLDSATPGSQTDAQPVSLDAIEQIQVSTAPYDVTQAGFTGASVNAVTKSGTNEFHGTVFGFYRNQDLAGNVDLGGTTLTPDLNQTQYGFSLGGPIVKDKLFFFANYEYDNRDDLGSYYVSNNGSQTVEGNVSRVLESDLQAVSTALKALGYETGEYQGYIHDTKSTKGIYKLDWNASKNTRVSLIYNFLRASKDRNAHPSAIGRRGPDLITMQFRNSGYTINNNIDSYLAEINSNFSNGKTTNKLQIGYTRFDDYRDAFSAPAPVININKNGQRYIIAGHEPFSINNRLDQKVFQLTNNMTHSFGNHTATIGFAFEKFQFDNSFNLVGYGFDVFGGYNSVGDFLADADPNTGTLAGKIAYAESQFNTDEWALVETNLGQMAFYLQDEWAATDDVKITAGLRIDKPLFFDTQQKVEKSIANAYWYSENIPYFDEDGNDVNLSSRDLPSTDFLFSPRIGFNWDIKGDNTMQLRGGSGIFTGRLPFVWIGNQVGNVNVDFYTSTDKNFQFPQIWKSSLGLDYKFENGLVTSFDASYSKDINGMMVRNYSIRNPTGTLSGVDNRPIYTAADRNGINQPWGSPIDSYIFTNTDVGYSYNATFKAEKSWENDMYLSFAYNFTEAMDASSIEAEITSDAYARNPAFGNVNKAVASHSLYGDRHRIIGVVSKKLTYGKWDTSIAGIYEYAQGGRFSYTYGGDVNGDGSNMNDLIYIPTESDINAMPFNTAEATEAEQRAALEAFIKQDDYMSANRGKYAEKYDVLSPWRGRWDLKLTQGYSLGGSKKLQFDLNMLNLTNLLNKDWGVIKLPTSSQPIGVSVDQATSTPTYSFDLNQKETFTGDYSLQSRWQVQGGLRFIF